MLVQRYIEQEELDLGYTWGRHGRSTLSHLQRGHRRLESRWKVSHYVGKHRDRVASARESSIVRQTNSRSPC